MADDVPASETPKPKRGRKPKPKGSGKTEAQIRAQKKYRETHPEKYNSPAAREQQRASMEKAALRRRIERAPEYQALAEQKGLVPYDPETRYAGPGRKGARRHPASGQRKAEYPPETHRLVADLARWGIKQEWIARHVIHPKTGKPISRFALAENFAEELAMGAREGDVVVVQSLFHHLLGREGEPLRDAEGNPLADKGGKPLWLREPLKPNVAAAIFLAKTRDGIGFRETTQIEHTKSIDSELADKLKTLTYDEKKQIQSILKKARDAAQGREPALIEAGDE